MKVIFSKKGFDSSYGYQSSIILPNNKMISFPIPETNPKNKGIAAEEINYKFKDETFNLQDLFNQLEITNKIKFQDKSKTKIFTDNKYHFDPEIFITSQTEENKYGALGQSGTAAGALLDESAPLQQGDVFLFFGTFQKTLMENNQIKYDKYMMPFHAIWGYMIVDDIIHIKPDDESIKAEYLEKYPNLEKHLHFINRKEEGDKNIIICGKRFGTFNYSEKYRLTKIGYQKTCWSLEDFFNDSYMKYTITEKKDRKINDSDRILVNGFGQEFVVTGIKDEEKLINWLKDLGVSL